MSAILNGFLEWFSALPAWTYIVFGVAIIAMLALNTYLRYRKQEKLKRKIKEQVQALANNALELSPDAFMQLRKTTSGGRGNPSIALKHNFAGVYILYNQTKNMYYIGQAQKILNRVNAHFTGKGNGDIYADYKYGDNFTIRMIALEHSGFQSLNELERHMISTYNAFATGYNKTRGNK